MLLSVFIHNLKDCLFIMNMGDVQILSLLETMKTYKNFHATNLKHFKGFSTKQSTVYCR